MRITKTKLGSTAARLGVGLVLFAAIAAALSIFMEGHPPAFAYLVSGLFFALSFKVAGEPLEVIPFRKGGRFGVAISYIIAALGMALAIYAIWTISKYTHDGSMA